MAGIYIHIPFCKSFCHYCDFYSITDNSESESFVQAVVLETAMQARYLDGETVETVYLGGGTPSLLTVGQTGQIISAVRKNFSFSDDPEITVEVNPDDVYEGYFRELAGIGVNRVSLGVQSWNDKRLKYLGRRHDAAQSAKALKLAFKEGIVNVSVDLIYGLPGMTTEDLKHDLEETFACPVTHLSAYHLTIEEGTRFGKMKKERKLVEPDEETSNAMFSLLGNYVP